MRKAFFGKFKLFWHVTYHKSVNVVVLLTTFIPEVRSIEDRDDVQGYCHLMTSPDESSMLLDSDEGDFCWAETTNAYMRTKNCPLIKTENDFRNQRIELFFLKKRQYHSKTFYEYSIQC